jgi:hypothetical protein
MIPPGAFYVRNRYLRSLPPVRNETGPSIRPRQ